MYKHLLAKLLIAIVGLYGIADYSYAGDELNCVLCHKFRGLSRIDKTGKFRLFYINQELFDSGPHRRNKCKDCHTDINKIPHDPAKKVDCTQECHMLEPSSQQKFSHKLVARILKKSVHSPIDKNGKPKKYQEDYPGCKDCHDQPFYRPFSIYKGTLTPGVSKRGITRCKSCHTKGYFAEDFYEHVTTRLRKSRSPLETINACAKCHQDKGFQKRHNLDDVVTTYKHTFHGELIQLGSERTPDCLDCHVVEGENIHLIESQTVPTSAVYKTNVQATCRTVECHSKAAAQLASFKTHVTYDREKYPLEFYMLIGFKALMAIVLYFFLSLIFMELLRRLFPGFSFFKEKNKNSKNK
ncbi:hypothetical protein MNBD_GAMMA24-669 [hydrothermal vent metagenome]|uniref:Uncharacterized protein n=1 Tax=hydrothermal vent metagenome TaxID=652676 RepID=A0A3B1CA05_9ZZZZ